MDIGNVKPNTTSFTIVMDAWARESATSGNYTTQEVEQIIFYEMERWDDWQPNIFTYNTMTNALAKHGETQRAEDLLQTMLQHLNMIHILTKSGTTQRAENVLRTMVDRYHQKGRIIDGIIFLHKCHRCLGKQWQ
mmetsp:Transcript_1720/g.2640  ORF Transcript_1720/g.2640 Transcript_1720/m.2640 type:complete len:135 (+) Transcript_1720:328-732(+)